MSTPSDSIAAEGTTARVTTLASAVYKHLRRDILAGALEPGSKLRIESTCARYQAGNTPVREALNRLAAEGLLQRADQRGFRVAPISLEELDELTRTRCAIDSLALRESLARRDAAWEEGLLLAQHRLARTPRSTSSQGYETNPTWEALHQAFHQALISHCGSRWLRRYSDELADHAYRYRQRSMRGAYPHRDVQHEHADLASAALSGDVEHCVALLQAHYQRTADLMRAGLLPDQAAEVSALAPASKRQNSRRK